MGLGPLLGAFFGASFGWVWAGISVRFWERGGSQIFHEGFSARSTYMAFGVKARHPNEAAALSARARDLEVRSEATRRPTGGQSFG